MGEQWSPYTEPARVAPNAGISTAAPSPPAQSIETMGSRIPNVPQAVPMEKDRKAATANTMAGRKLMGSLAADTKLLTNSPVPIISLHTPPSAQASISMVSAGIIVLIPSMIPVMNSCRLISFRGIYMAIATSSAANVPRVSPAVGFSPMASAKDLPSKPPPT